MDDENEGGNTITLVAPKEGEGGKRLRERKNKGLRELVRCAEER